jgi:hypothetical protein
MRLYLRAIVSAPSFTSRRQRNIAKGNCQGNR